MTFKKVDYNTYIFGSHQVINVEWIFLQLQFYYIWVSKNEQDLLNLELSFENIKLYMFK